MKWFWRFLVVRCEREKKGEKPAKSWKSCERIHDLINIYRTMSPIEAPLWTPSCKIETIPRCKSRFLVYTGELSFGQTIWDKNPGAIGNILRNAFENTLETWEPFENLRTHWEHDGNTLGKREKTKKKSLFSPLEMRKNWIVHECMVSLPIGCMKFLFPKLFIPIVPSPSSLELFLLFKRHPQSSEGESTISHKWNFLPF